MNGARQVIYTTKPVPPPLPLPLGWKWVQLRQLATAEDAFADGPFGSHLKTEHYSPSGVRVVRLQNIGRGVFLDQDRAFIPDERFRSLEKHSVQPDDVVVAALGNGARPAGRACVVPKGIGRAIVKADCFRIRLPPTRIIAPYLTHYLNSPQALATIESAMRGATRPRVTLAILRELWMPLAPLEEQRRVAATLDAQLTDVGRVRVAAFAQLEAVRHLLAAVLRRAFEGVTPLAVGPPPFPPPPAWRWIKLTALARLESGHTPSRRRSDWWGGAIPWISLQDIRALDGTLVHDTVERTNEAGIANSSARVLPRGTVVLSRTASVGFVTIMGRPMATSQDFASWICGPDLDPTFLAYLLRASRDLIRSVASGAVHKTVYMPTIEAFHVCVPGLVEQRRIAGILQERFHGAAAISESIDSQLAAIRTFPSALLRRAFSDRALKTAS